MGGERGWAQALLSWGWRGMVLEAEVSVCRYFVRPAVGEVIAWGEVREAGGRVRVEVGSFGTVGAARAACERDAARRVRAVDREARREARGAGEGPVDVRISAGRGRRRPVAAGDVVRAPARGGDGYAALDAALAAFAGVMVGEDRG